MRRVSRRAFVRATAASPLAFAPSAAAQAAASPPGSRIPLGIVTYNIARDWDLGTLIRNCRLLGLQAVELRTTHKHGVEPVLTEKERAEVKKKFKESGLTLWGLGTTCEFHSPDQAVLRRNIETCRAFCTLARDVGAKGVKVRPNGLPRGVPVEKTVQQIGGSLNECGRIGRKFDVEIWCEVHGRGTAEPAVMARIMAACNHPNVGVTWNCNRSDVKNGSVKESFRLLQKWIRSLHLKELYDPHYPYRELFSLLRGHGYRGYALAEIGSSSDPLRVMRYFAALFYELQR